MDSVMKAFDTVIQLSGKVWDLATSNAYFAIFLAVRLLFVGVSVFRAIKRAASR